MTERIIHGDCLDVMRAMDADSIDATITDPPYELGFMGKAWDRGGIAFNVDLWEAALRVAKPGTYLLAFGGTRTYHRMACAIEDAGWEIHDCLTWLYGSGFPKHKSKLKPAWEPIVMARKPAPRATPLNIDACRLATADTLGGGRLTGPTKVSEGWDRPWMHDEAKRAEYAARTAEKVANAESLGRWPANVCCDAWDEQVLYLRDNLTPEVASLIREYFRDYSRLPNLSGGHLHAAEPEASQEVLQPGMLRGVSHDEARSESPSVRQDAHAGIIGEDASAEGSENEARAGEPQLEGRARTDARLRDGVDHDAPASRAGNVCVDGARPQQTDTGASSSNGAEARATVAVVGDCPSPQRQEGRQPAKESGTPRQRDAQTDASIHPPRITRVASRERTIAVLACDVPAGWRHYFRDSGLVVPSPDGAAEAIDAQSGERGLSSGGGMNRDGTNNTVYGAASGHSIIRDVGYGDTGGASRFYYCAKASRSEREAGLDGIERKRGGSLAHSQSSLGVKDGRDAPRGNHHPTVKPVALMRWLVRLVTPIGGTVLDPFAGSGTTGIAAVEEDRSFIGIENEKDYVPITDARIRHVADQGSLFRPVE